MKQASEVKFYPIFEEKLNVLAHALGFLLSLLALPLLLYRAHTYDDVLYMASFAIFGFSLIALYTASSFYHNTLDPILRSRLRVADHVSIYFLIAGTYTPFTLHVLPDSLGWLIFSVAWAMALTGTVLKLFFTGRYKVISTLMYVSMGWLIVFAINPLAENLSVEGLNWLIAGGVAYTLGAVLYGIKKLKFNHAIFHVFVLLGSVCHFMSVYFYIRPAA